VLVGRDGRRQLVQRLAERAGVALSPAAAWLIVRLHDDADADIPQLCQDFDLPLELGERALQELQERGMVVIGGDHRTVTPAGEDAAEKLIAERRASLARVCDGWAPEDNPDLAALLTDLAKELAREPSEHDVVVPA
jgi:DNA-binding MarR family transcriptional regulator